MYLVEMKMEDLITPDQFELTSQDDLFDRLVSVVNNELEEATTGENEIFATEEAHIEVILNADDDFSEDVTPEMVKSLAALYQSIGWKTVTYEHQEENEDNYESHIFKFYFCTQPSTPGISL